jgi:hypothetical protein
VDFVIEGFLDYKREVGALGAIAVIIFAFITVPLKGIGKHFFCLADLGSNLRKIGKLHRSPVFLNQGLDIDSIEFKIIILYVKIFLGKVKGLLHQIGVCIVHLG